MEGPIYVLQKNDAGPRLHNRYNIIIIVFDVFGLLISKLCKTEVKVL